MHPEQENFDSLRRLLALKRHEVPPPGYFHNFSGQVIARIRAGEVSRNSFWENLSWEAPWLRRLWEAFETKPIMAGVLGMAVCGLLVSGVVLSEKAANPTIGTMADSGVSGSIAENSFQPNPVARASTIGIAPEQSFTASIDGFTPVNFSFPSGN